jgi:prepilin-type processing-associated H-X9-DG protein
VVQWLSAIYTTVLANQSAAVTGGATSAAGQAINNRTANNVGVTAPNGNGGGNSVMRLKEGVERFMITDINNPAAGAKAQSTMFIMWDRLTTNISKYNHVPGGSNVLYMDGHVEWIKYPGKDPVNVGFATFDGTVDSNTSD